MEIIGYWLSIVLIGAVIIGLIYVLGILYYARKMQKYEHYDAEKAMETWDLGEVEGMNLNYVEQVTKSLIKHDFRWVDDYKITEKHLEYLKLSIDPEAKVACYVRYFVNDVQSTVASIAFYRVYQRDACKNNGIERVACMHYFSLETALKSHRHLQSAMIYEPSVGSEVLEELLKVPECDWHLYEQEGEIEEMIRDHEHWIRQAKNTEGVDSVAMLKPLEMVLKIWWHRRYALTERIYQYCEDEACYHLTLSHCIKLVLMCPFFQLHKKLQTISKPFP